MNRKETITSFGEFLKIKKFQPTRILIFCGLDLNPDFIFKFKIKGFLSIKIKSLIALANYLKSELFPGL